MLKHAIEARNGKWIQLTPEQWEFLRGIYAMNPLTPPGLPYGDKAALAKVDGNDGGLVFFIDGDKACTPMPVPQTLLSMMDDVATAKINHEGDGLDHPRGRAPRHRVRIKRYRFFAADFRARLGLRAPRRNSRFCPPFVGAGRPSLRGRPASI